MVNEKCGGAGNVWRSADEIKVKSVSYRSMAFCGCAGEETVEIESERGSYLAQEISSENCIDEKDLNSRICENWQMKIKNFMVLLEPEEKRYSTSNYVDKHYATAQKLSRMLFASTAKDSYPLVYWASHARKYLVAA